MAEEVVAEEPDNSVKEAVKENDKSSTGKQQPTQRPKGRKDEDINLEEYEMDEEIRKALLRQKQRRKHQQKRLQYTFLFKIGAFLVMLAVVLITKQVQKYMKGGKGDDDTSASSKKRKSQRSHHDGVAAALQGDTSAVPPLEDDISQGKNSEL
mmetsp:Transcript_13358/g.31310  ORF Transcript_13358/g.31310 Transcript_13358/m.31310 type:complete len:153 (+) Transcript_13358:87-545(+)